MILPARPSAIVTLEDEDATADLLSARRFTERVPLYPDAPDQTLWLTRLRVWVLEREGRYRRLAPVVAKVWLVRNGYDVRALPQLGP